MLPQDAFLRRMPRALALEDRLRLEAIVTSCDIINLAYRRLAGTLTELAESSDALTVLFETRIEVTTHCWAIIDHLHNLRELTKKLQQDDAGFATFALSIEPATLMRNAMDHLKSRLGNLSQTKSSALPMHGCVSFASLTNDGFEWVQLPLGAPHHRQQHFAVIDTWTVAPVNTIDHINFAAFDGQLDFSRVTNELRELLIGLNKAIEMNISEQAEHTAAENKVDVTALLADRVTGTFLLRISKKPCERAHIDPEHPASDNQAESKETSY